MVYIIPGFSKAIALVDFITWHELTDNTQDFLILWIFLIGKTETKYLLFRYIHENNILSPPFFCGKYKMWKHTKASEFQSQIGLLMTNFSHRAIVIQEAMVIFIQNWTLQLTLSLSSKVIPKESYSGHSSFSLLLMSLWNHTLWALMLQGPNEGAHIKML